MNVTAVMDAPCEPGRVFALVDELIGYPSWMSLVHRAEGVAAGSDGRPAWSIELRARLGPLARSKRLRMVRTVHDLEGHRVRFERCELDGRSHAPWVLDATVVPTSVGSRLDMHLHYGGTLWTGGIMERVLADQIEAGRGRLLAMLAADEPAG